MAFRGWRVSAVVIGCTAHRFSSTITVCLIDTNPLCGRIQCILYTSFIHSIDRLIDTIPPCVYPSGTHGLYTCHQPEPLAGLGPNKRIMLFHHSLPLLALSLSRLPYFSQRTHTFPQQTAQQNVPASLVFSHRVFPPLRSPSWNVSQI